MTMHPDTDNANDRAYQARLTRAKLDLHTGAIDEASFRELAREAAEIYNRQAGPEQR